MEDVNIIPVVRVEVHGAYRTTTFKRRVYCPKTGRLQSYDHCKWCPHFYKMLVDRVYCFYPKAAPR